MSTFAISFAIFLFCDFPGNTGNPLMFSYRAPRFILTESSGGDTMVYQCDNCTGELKMIKNLVKHGNSWALVIDRPILDLLQIDPECPVELTTDGSSIRIAPATDDSRKGKLRQASKKVNARYKKTFQKLAE